VGALQGGAAAWTPASEIEATLPTVWLLPNDTATLFQDNAKTIAASADTDPLGAIADKSGNGNDFISTTDGTRLQRKNNAANSKVGILHNTNTNGAQKAGLLSTAYQKNTSMIAVNTCGTGSSHDTSYINVTTYTKDRFFDSADLMYFSFPEVQAAKISYASGYGKKIVAFSYNGKRALLKTNHHTWIEPATTNIPTGTISIGYNGLGSVDASTMEFLVYNRGLTETSLNQIIAYEANSFGLTVPAETQRVIAIGDSLLSGFGMTLKATTWLDYFMVAKNSPLIHAYRVCRGDGITATMYAAAGAYQASDTVAEFVDSTSIVFIMIGTNDLKGSRTGLQVYTDIVSITNQLKAANSAVRIITATVIARGNLSAPQETERLDLNSRIVAGYATIGTALLDLAADARFQNASDTTYYNADTIHLIAAGQSVLNDLATVVYNAL
jgi:lysophospholipase L1-like esterase